MASQKVPRLTMSLLLRPGSPSGHYSPSAQACSVVPKAATPVTENLVTATPVTENLGTGKLGTVMWRL